MAVLTVTGDDLVIHQLAGTACFLRARDHIRRGEVRVTGGDLDGGQLLGWVGVGAQAHTATVVIGYHPDGGVAHVTCTCTCTCTASSCCQHAAALALVLVGKPIAASRVHDSQADASAGALIV